MKLEVGKVYVTRSGRKMAIVGLSVSRPGTVLAETEDGSVYRYSPDGYYRYDTKEDCDLDLVREYREPVVHERWVAGFRNAGGPFFFLTFPSDCEVAEWVKLHPGYKHLGIQKITFTEQPE